MTSSARSRSFAPVLTSAATAAALASLAFAADAPPPVFSAADRAAMERQTAEADKLPDPPGTGHFRAMKEEVTSLPHHVVYRPADLAALKGLKLGVVAWGNGGCSDDGAGSRFHLLELASHGYLVIANGKILSGPGAPAAAPPAPPAPGQLPPPRTKASELTESIDWALKENSRQGSPYFGRIDPKQIAVSGWSCGGVQALKIGADPRVKTLVLHNTGVFNGPSLLPEMDIGKDALKKLHTPLIYVLGGPQDIAYANGMDDFKRIEHLPVAVANLPVGHGGTFLQSNGGAAASVAVSWLDWQLRGDKQAARRFTGAECGLCKDKDWSLERKHFPAP